MANNRLYIGCKESGYFTFVQKYENGIGNWDSIDSEHDTRFLERFNEVISSSPYWQETSLVFFDESEEFHDLYSWFHKEGTFIK